MDKNDSNIMTQRIKSEARQLSAKYKLDQKRVVNVLHKIAEINWYDSSNATYSELEKAFDYLSPDDALDLFEKEDLTRLATRVMLVEYLNDNTIPFYTLDKLADLTKEFIDHLHENKDHLLKTGFPETTFEKSPWLDKHLNKLYFIKMPVSVHEKVLPSIGRRKGKLENIYFWNEATVDSDNAILLHIKETIKELKQYQYTDRKDKESQVKYEVLSVHLHDMLRQLEEWNLTNYDVAPFIQGLTEEDAIKIEGIRDKLFNLKISVLERLYNSAKRKNKNKLITDCVKIINKYLTAEEIDFLIKKDHFYNNLVNVSNGENSYYLNIDNSLINHNAGLSDLFMVIGHFYKEIELSTMDEVHESLEELPGKRIPKSYYRAIGKPWQDELNQIIFFYVCLEERDKLFWDSYSNQINSMHYHNVIGHSDDIELSLLQMKKEPIVMTPELFAEKYMNEEDFKQIVNEGDRPIVLLSELPPVDVLKTPDLNYVFRKMKKGWHIVYENNKAFFRNYIGFEYIVHLLAKRAEEYDASYLYQAVKGYSHSSNPLQNMTEEQLQKEGVSKAGSKSEKLVDSETIRQFNEKIQEYEDQFNEAINNGDYNKADSIEQEKEIFIEWSKKEFGENYKRRTENIDKKRVRDAVKNAIRRAITAIGSEIPPLAEHLKHAIKTRHGIGYYPTEDITWLTKPQI